MKTLAVVLILLSSLGLAHARPDPELQFTCADGTFAFLDAYVFFDATFVHVVQVCENGPTTNAWPTFPDALGNVWWIYLFIDVSNTETGEVGYCILEFSTSKAVGSCAGGAQRPEQVDYLLSIPNVE